MLDKLSKLEYALLTTEIFLDTYCTHLENINFSKTKICWLNNAKIEDSFLSLYHSSVFLKQIIFTNN